MKVHGVQVVLNKEQERLDRELKKLDREQERLGLRAGVA
jgi:hypothetical protein